MQDSKLTVDGVSLSHTSDSVCAFDETKTYQFYTDILCDEAYTEAGLPYVTGVIFDSFDTGVTSDDQCTVRMTFKHETGCPILDLYRLKLLFTNNEWLTGIVCIIAGLFIGLFGLRFLRPIAGILIGVAFFVLTIALSSIFELFVTVPGIVLTFVVAVIGAIIVGILTLYFIWLAIGFLGMLGGFFLAQLVYELTLMRFDFSHAWGFLALTVAGVIIGTVLAFKYGREVIVFSTSLVGGLAIMRGTSLFFPNGIPTMAEMVQSIVEEERKFELNW